MPEIPPLGEMSRSDKRGAVSARRKLSRSGATRLKRLEVVLRTNPGAVEGTPSRLAALDTLPKGEGTRLRRCYSHREASHAK